MHLWLLEGCIYGDLDVVLKRSSLSAHGGCNLVTKLVANTGIDIEFFMHLASCAIRRWQPETMAHGIAFQCQ
jgi:hypothetical protein